MRRSPLRIAGTVLVAVTALTCTDAITGPRLHGPTPLALAPHFSLQAERAAQQLSGFALTIDNIHLVLVRPPSAVLVDSVINVPPDAQEMSVALSVQLEAAAETLSVQLQLRNQQTVLFSGVQSVVATQGGNSGSEPTPVTLEYAGPGSDATRLSVSPLDTTVQATTHAAFSTLVTTDSGVPVQGLPVIWTSSDPTVAIVDGSGDATGLAAGTTTITARGLNGLTAEASLHVIDPAVALKLISGDGQSGVVGAVLASPVVVKVVGASGNGVPGISVRFRPQDTSGKVFDTTVVSGPDGIASAEVLLGDSLGVQLFEASASGVQTIAFKATALQAPPGQQIVVQSGAGQTGGVGSLLQPLVVFVHDPAGQPVSGATVTWRLVNGSASLSAPSSTTDSKGIASVQVVLDTMAAPLSIEAATLDASVLFDLTAVPLAAAKLVMLTEPSDTTMAGVILAVQPSVRLVDPYGNPVKVAGKKVQASLGLGCDGPCLSTTPAVSRLSSRSARPSGMRLLTPGSRNDALTEMPLHLDGDSVVTTDANGVATFQRLAMYMYTGGYSLSFSVDDTAFVEPATSRSIEVIPGVPAFAQSWLFPTTITSGTEGSPIPDSERPSVLVTDSIGNTIPNFPVQFTLAAGNGIATGTDTVTDAFGVATVGSWILPVDIDTVTMVATAGSLTGSPVTFTAIPQQILSATLEIMLGNDQDALPDSLLPSPFVARVLDQAGAPLAGDSVRWTLAGGDGTGTFGLAGQTIDTVLVTDDTGFVSMDFRFAGAPGSTALISAQSVSGYATGFFTASALPVGATKRWVGGYGADPAGWNDAENWRPSGTPTASDIVFVPLTLREGPHLTTDVSVGELFVGLSGMLDLSDFSVTAAGTVHGGMGGIKSNKSTASVIMAGQGLVQGILPSLEVRAAVSVDTLLMVTGSLTVTSGGNLDVGTASVSAMGAFATQGTGVLTMVDKGTVQLQGGAVFDGGDETGKLLMGQMLVMSKFTQLATNSPNSFVADSTHETIFADTAAQIISFESAGSSQSRFAFLNFANDAGVTVSTNAYAGRDISIGGLLTVPTQMTLGSGAQVTLQAGSTLVLDGTVTKRSCVDLGGKVLGLNVLLWTCP